ncbi:DUF3108 domain-containing protein [Acidobacteria bacterium AH-259-L09]|nr:DUF3108 domain-containing protein [Acidobacteria bacterium AH-259-L09]
MARRIRGRELTLKNSICRCCTRWTIFFGGTPATISPLRCYRCPAIYQVTFKVEGRERVKTPAGDFNCYKVEMDVDLGFLNLFKVFVPDTHFWFTVDPPHFWVRYEGLERGRGSPKVVRASTGHRDGGRSTYLRCDLVVNQARLGLVSFQPF